MASTLSTDGDTVAEAVVQVSGMLEHVFTTIQQTCEQTATMLAHISGQGRRPTSADLAQLQPLLREQLSREAELISGTGFIAEPGLLSDVPAWLEWWQTRADGEVQPLLLDLDPDTTAFSDYTSWDWFALPRTTGQRAVSGPYVDYLCSDEYSLTLAAPVVVDGAFAGVAAADVYLRHFEAGVGPALRRIEGPAFLVNPRGRVTASNTATQLAGSLVRDLDAAAARGEVVLHPCEAIPLVFVTAARASRVQ